MEGAASNMQVPITAEEQRRVDGFLQLSRIERGLRAFIEKRLQGSDGARWPNALPPDVREKVNEGGLEFTDFPDLKKILGSNWKKFDQPTVGFKKHQVINHLEGLESIRNDIAHSRAISEGALALVQAAYYVLSPLIEEAHAPIELPSTQHPEVALNRVRGAINQSLSVGRSDLSLLEQDEAYSHVCRAISGYERVRTRPGRKPQLLAEVRAQALQAIEKCPMDVGEVK